MGCSHKPPGQTPIDRRALRVRRRRTVVAVGQDVRVRGLERSSQPQVYLPSQQVGDGAMIRYTGARSSAIVGMVLGRPPFSRWRGWSSGAVRADGRAAMRTE